ncbi:hypothetical protein [Pseudomonas sp. NFIX28]|uniref:hypothetical protein n=1 Tax=Pseudomonas sp. NFIX28 TaxID=1566235 RepID=UPI001113B802|nr:hypothetical protein [Pseudomonas sp. NFIX28]
MMTAFRIFRDENFSRVTSGTGLANTLDKLLQARHLHALTLKHKIIQREEILQGGVVSDLDIMMASSYRPVANRAKTEKIAKYNANTPNSSSLYRLINIGPIATGIAWARAIPAINVMTLRKKNLSTCVWKSPVIFHK